MFFIICVVLIFLICLYSWIVLLKDSKLTNVPGPTPLPILGNGHLFVGDSTKFLETLDKLATEYQDVFRLYVLHTRIVVISDPKYIENVLSSSEMLTKGQAYRTTRYWLGDGLLLTTDSKWKAHRKLLTPAFHYNILQSFLPVFVKNDKLLMNKLRQVADGRTFNIFPMVALATLDMITEAVMGVSIQAQTSLENKYVRAVERMCKIISLRTFNPFLKSDFGFNMSPYKKIQRDTLEILHGKAYEVIDARRRELEKSGAEEISDNPQLGIKNKKPFLDLLLLAEVNGKKLDDVSIREEVDTFMFAGHDTTASGIAFTVYCLSKHPEVQERVLMEQKLLFGDDLLRDPSYSDIQEMRYLDMVLKESLRLYDPVPVIERLMTRDINIEGLNLKKDTTVSINLFRLHRNPSIFEDPLEFKPERFETTNLKPFQWLPFSAGPRNCIGQKFAMTEMKLVLSSIVRNFEILPSGIEPELGADIILRAKNGILVKLLPRS